MQIKSSQACYSDKNRPNGESLNRFLIKYLRHVFGRFEIDEYFKDTKLLLRDRLIETRGTFSHPFGTTMNASRVLIVCKLFRIKSTNYID